MTSTTTTSTCTWSSNRCCLNDSHALFIMWGNIYACVFWQSLSGVQGHWNSLLKLSDDAVRQSIGGLCLSVTVSCYLASEEPHVLMEMVHVQLVPLLMERGVEMFWDTGSNLLTIMPSISHTTHVCDETAHEKSMSGGTVSVEVTLPENDLSTSSRLVSCSYASLCNCLLSYTIPEALVEIWFSQPVISHSPSFLFFAGLLDTSWNRWPLIFDPQGMAFRWVFCYKEGVVHLDARTTTWVMDTGTQSY